MRDVSSLMILRLKIYLLFVAIFKSNQLFIDSYDCILKKGLVVPIRIITLAYIVIVSGMSPR
jgi:hypothetical protein